jgi:hypothetical protein
MWAARVSLVLLGALSRLFAMRSVESGERSEKGLLFGLGLAVVEEGACACELFIYRDRAHRGFVRLSWVLGAGREGRPWLLATA